MEFDKNEEDDFLKFMEVVMMIRVLDIESSYGQVVKFTKEIELKTNKKGAH